MSGRNPNAVPEMPEHRILALTSDPALGTKKELVQVVNYWARECCIEAARRVSAEDHVKLLCRLLKSLKTSSRIASIVAELSGCNESTTSGQKGTPKRKRSRNS